MTRITGAEARELLDIWAGDVEGLTFAQLGADRSYGDLFGAAPALAETVVWLYEREPAEQDVLITEGGSVGVYAAGMHGEDHEYLTPDEAVDLARALLSAAEEARQ